MMELREQSDALAERLAGALRFRTINYLNGSGNQQHDAFAGLHNYLTEKFPRSHRTLVKEQVGDANALLMTWQGKAQESTVLPWLFISHQDVVPADDETLWRYPPFSGTFAEGHVWGRGALDLKVTMVAILEAIENLIASGFAPKRSVYLAFGGDEEVGGYGGAAAIAALLRSREIRFSFSLDEGGLIVRNCLPGVGQPVALIGTAQKGFATIRMTAHAKGGHGAVPVDRGAIDRLARAIKKIGDSPMPARLDGPTADLFDRMAETCAWPVSWFYRGSRSLGLVMRWVLPFFPELDAASRCTSVVTTIEGGVAQNAVPQTASCILDCRLKPGHSVADLAHHLRNVVNDSSIRLEVLRSHPASEVSPTDHSSYQCLDATLEEVFPEAVSAPYLALNDTDSKHYQGLVEAQYRFVPITLERADLARIHGTDERISVADYVRLVEFYMSLIRRLDAASE